MKRLIMRTAALAGVLAIGWIAIAQAQRGDDQSPSLSPPADQVDSELTTTTRTPAPPAPLRAATGNAVDKATDKATAVGRSNPLRPPSAAEKAVRLPAPPRSASKGVLKTAHAQDPLTRTPLTRTPLTRTPLTRTPLARPVDVLPVSNLATTGDGDRYATKNGPNRLPQNLAVATPLAANMTNTAPPLAPPPAEKANTIPQGPGPAIPMPAAATKGPTLTMPMSAAIAKRPQRIAEGTGMPAKDHRFEGVQTPQLTIEKFAPAEIQVGNPARFRVVVRNTGSVIARGVEIRDQVPQGTRLIETNPRASRGVGGELVWKLGDMKPGEEKTAEAKLMPLAEGEIGSVATIHFSAGASVRTVSTKPQLVLETSAPKTVMIGKEMKLTINVSNPGSGVARGVVLTEQVPAGLQHPSGSELEYAIGDLKPNESRTLELKLAAVRPGKIVNVLLARAEAGLHSKEELPIEVVAPHLQLAISGPQHRFLQRKTTYKLSVSNPGTALARNVRLQAKLPNGLRFVGANNNGHYDPQTKTVAWALAELPVNETGTVLLTAMPVEIGEQKLTYRGAAEGALSVEEQKEILVDGIAAMRFEVVDVEDPVEQGGEAIYEIRVVNQGTKAGSNVRIQVTLPPAMQLVDAEGPSGSRAAVTGNKIAFEPLRRLSPKVDTTYRVRVKCTAAGDQRISVQLQTDEMQSPVTKEESTRVFSDN